MKESEKILINSSLLLEELILRQKGIIPKGKEKKEINSEKKDFEELYLKEKTEKEESKLKIKELTKKKDLLYSDIEKLKKIENALNTKVESLSKKIETLVKELQNIFDESKLTATSLNKEIALKVLGLEDTASKEEIKEVYKRLLKIYHPDHLKVALNYKARNIVLAYEFLEKNNFI
ncbi:MAG: DnaJ domain-containing protein [Candidatus Sericytochromatia bacterium]